MDGATALNEVQINKFSQLVYLDVPPELGEEPTVGALAAYYLENPAAGRYLKARFGGIQEEYRLWQEFLSGGIADIAGVRICNIQDDNAPDQSGFYGCCFDDGERLVAAFRGSELLGSKRYENDYRTDFALAYAEQTPQQKQVDVYLRRFTELSRRPFVVTGHSLGGNLAVYAAVCAPEEVQKRLSGCYSFNGPGFNDGFCGVNGPLIRAMSPRIYLYQNRYDLISSLLHSVAEPIIIASAFIPAEQEKVDLAALLYPHSNFQYRKDAEDRFLRDSTGKKDQLCQAVHQFSLRFLELPVQLKETVCTLILDVYFSTRPPEQKLHYLMEELTRVLMLHQVHDLGGSGLILSSAAFVVRHTSLFRQTEESVYRRIVDPTRSEIEQTADVAQLLLRLFQWAAEMV